MLKLRLFGTGRASYFDRPLAGFPNQQCFLLLCYLLLNRHHPHHRERLAAVFWSECSSATSRQYLRNALWRLRQALRSAGVAADDFLSISEESVSFLGTSPYWLDIEVFESTVTQLQEIKDQDLTTEHVARIEEVVDLYAGDLLEGVYDDWCLYDRERLRLLYLTALTRLLVFHELDGTYERGLAYGNLILARDPTREKVHRALMRLYWLLGDRNEALTQYNCCAQILRQELGVRPMDQTTRLYEQMVHNQFDPANRPIYRDDPLPERLRQAQSAELLGKHALEKVRQLQGIAEDTRAELHLIERLISRALISLKQT